MNLSGNTVLITGGSSGIGYALAEAFLAANSQVIVCARDAERLLDARARHPSLHSWVCDVSDEESRRNMAEWIADRFPGLNILVNNAGIQRDLDFTRGIDDFRNGENEIRTNLEAVVVLCGLFVPVLAKNGQAAIVNVSSGLGFVPSARMPVYSASKAGVHAYSMAIRRQLSPIGIQVIEVVPPAVDTELNPLGRAKRGHFKAGLSAATFVESVMKQLEGDTLEIGYGATEGLIHASRAELDLRFDSMNP